MNIKDRDRIFEECGFIMVPNEPSMGIGIWTNIKESHLYIIAKYMGSWDYFTIAIGETWQEVYSREENSVGFKIKSEHQLREILTSII